MSGHGALHGEASKGEGLGPTLSKAEKCPLTTMTSSPSLDKLREITAFEDQEAGHVPAWHGLCLLYPEAPPPLPIHAGVQQHQLTVLSAPGLGPAGVWGEGH